jgi:hypothetical protein
MTPEQYITMTHLAHDYALKQGEMEFDSSYEDFKEGYEAALISNEQIQEYAAFCIQRDRKGLPIIIYKDYLKL